MRQRFGWPAQFRTDSDFLRRGSNAEQSRPPTAPNGAPLGKQVRVKLLTVIRRNTLDRTAGADGLCRLVVVKSSEFESM